MQEKLDFNMTKQQKTSKMIFAFYIFCLLSAIVYSITHNSLVGTVTALAICLVTFLSPAEETFLLIFGLQFLRVVIPVQLGAATYGFILFVYAVFIAKVFIKHKTLLPEQLLVLILLLLDIGVSALNGVFKIGDNINWVFSLLYMLFVLKKYVHKIDFERLVIYFLLAQWTICLINIIAEYRIFGQTLIPDMYGVFTDELEAFAFGKAYAELAGGNGISFNTSFAIALCILLFSYVKKTRTKVFYIASIFFLGYCGIMTISRGFYVELLLFFVLLLLASAKKPSRFALYLFVIGLVAVVIFAFYDTLFVNFERVLVRFERGNENREMLIYQAQQLLLNDFMVFFFGAGSYYPDIYDFTAHNLFFDSFVSLGVFGALSYWGTIAYSMFATIKRYVKLSLKAMIPLIMLFSFKLISGSTRDVGFYYYIVLALVFAIFITRKDQKNAEEDHCVYTSV